MRDIAGLRSLCRAHSVGTSVSSAANGLPDWVIDDVRLKHAKADYFSVGLYATTQGAPILLMEQKEPALIMLLAAAIEGRESVLLSLRTEPGLIGLTNLSTTIQSTASNYLRRHGGKATPFIEIASAPRSYGAVVYQGEHRDWGDHYCLKTKTFLIVKLATPVEAPPGFCWVDRETARALLLEDHLITNDLRVAIPLMDAAAQAPTADTDSALREPGSPPLRSLAYTPGVVDSRGTTVAFFRTHTETREVQSWVQPLLVPKGTLNISLSFVRSASQRWFAVERRTQPGLVGRQCWFPANLAAGQTVRVVSTSAEGGRFWRYPITMRLVDVGSTGEPSDRTRQGVRWMPEEELAELVARPLQSSLELRMAWSLVHAEGSRTV